MAQDTRTIKIEITNIQANKSGMQISQKKRSSIEESQNDIDRSYKSEVSSALNEVIHPISSTMKDFAGSSVRKQAIATLAQQAMNIIEQSIEYGVTRHLNLTEDYIAQNNYNKIKSIYSLTKGAASAVASGISMGAAFGPAGLAAGMTIGLANWGINTTIQQSQRYSEYYQQLNATNFNTQYNQKRAGLYDGSRGTEG